MIPLKLFPTMPGEATFLPSLGAYPHAGGGTR